MIHSFADRAAEDLFHGRPSKAAKAFAGLEKIIVRKLDMLNAAKELRDLASPPGNHLEALKGDLKGRHSIRINRQWRIVFRWRDGAHEVEIRDYH